MFDALLVFWALLLICLSVVSSASYFLYLYNRVAFGVHSKYMAGDGI